MTEPKVPTKPFVQWLQEHKHGEFDTELTARLRELIDAVQDTGKNGTITLVLKVERRSDRQVTVKEDVKLKLPEHDRSESIYFVDGAGNLTRTDPQQEVLPFKRPLQTAGSDGEK